jgi:hypothetical protein
MGAEICRELGEPELGSVICASDQPAVKAHKPQLGFTRTQVLMHGDAVCNHVFFVEPSEPLAAPYPIRLACGRYGASQRTLLADTLPRYPS